VSEGASPAASQSDTLVRFVREGLLEGEASSRRLSIGNGIGASARDTPHCMPPLASRTPISSATPSAKNAGCIGAVVTSEEGVKETEPVPPDVPVAGEAPACAAAAMAAAALEAAAQARRRAGEEVGEVKPGRASRASVLLAVGGASGAAPGPRPAAEAAGDAAAAGAAVDALAPGAIVITDPPEAVLLEDPTSSATGLLVCIVACTGVFATGGRD